MSFTPLTGTGAAGAYKTTAPYDPFGHETAELIRTNFNDHETRIGAAASAVVVQQVRTETGTLATGTTTVPLDNTIPQNTEGDEYMTLAITPTNAANLLQVDVTFIGGPNSAWWFTTALFRDSTANAVGAHLAYHSAGMIPAHFRKTVVAGSTAATTFKVRAGASGAGTTTINGWNGVAYMGGVLVSSITITELTP